MGFLVKYTLVTRQATRRERRTIRTGRSPKAAKRESPGRRESNQSPCTAPMASERRPRPAPPRYTPRREGGSGNRHWSGTGRRPRPGPGRRTRAPRPRAGARGAGVRGAPRAARTAVPGPPARPPAPAGQAPLRARTAAAARAAERDNECYAPRYRRQCQ